MAGDEIGKLSRVFFESMTQLYGADATGGDDNLDQVVRVVASTVEGCRWASVSDHRARTLAASDELARQVDTLQREVEEGPCLAAANDQSDLYSIDVSDAGEAAQFPRFAAALVAHTPVRSALALPLRADGVALNLFSDLDDAFDVGSVTQAVMFSAHLSTLVALRRSRADAQNLQVALESSRTIGAAIGVLMNAHRITREAAYERLRDVSQALNRKLRAVAEDVVDTGVLPDR